MRRCETSASCEGLAVNRQFRDEALAAFYGRNMWWFTSPDSIIPFFRSQPLARERMRRATIEIEAYNHTIMATDLTRPWVLGFRYISRRVHLTHLQLMIEYDTLILQMAEDDEDLFDAGPTELPWLFALVRINGLNELQVDMRQDGVEDDERLNAHLEEQERRLTAELKKRMVKKPNDAEDTESEEDYDQVRNQRDDSTDEQSDEDNGEREATSEEETTSEEEDWL